MIKENKLSKYVLYAIGEIILVVIGILIALQVNDWNENRKHDLAEKEFFKSVKEDLKQDLEFIEYVQAYTKPKIDAYHLLNSTYLKSSIVGYTEKINNKLVWCNHEEYKRNKLQFN
mgnify:CR=1 FL=1